MKRLIVAFLTLSFLNTTLLSMECTQDYAHVAPLALKHETFSDSYEISLDHNGEKIAYITYKPCEQTPDAWEIDFIFVECEHRRKGYCALLFVECFKHILAKNARVVSWHSCPIEGNIHPDDLNAMYQKLITTKIMPLKSGTLQTLRMSANNTKMFYNFNVV